jgi:hypothetical protein
LKATQLFGFLRKEMLASKDVWTKVKRHMFIGMLLPVLLDGAETWIVTADLLREISTAYNRMVRGALRMTTYHTRKYRITTEQCCARLGLQTLDHYLDWKILGYAGHVQRMGPERLPLRTRNATMQGRRPVGRPQKSHADQITECLRRKQVKSISAASDKTKWREIIKKPTPTTRPQRQLEPWETKPREILGREVEKKFRHKWFAGTIVDTDVDADTNEQIWEVLYDDGDREDYNAPELKKLL